MDAPRERGNRVEGFHYTLTIDKYCLLCYNTIERRIIRFINLIVIIVANMLKMKIKLVFAAKSAKKDGMKKDVRSVIIKTFVRIAEKNMLEQGCSMMVN